MISLSVDYKNVLFLFFSPTNILHVLFENSEFVFILFYNLLSLKKCFLAYENIR